MVQKMHKTLLVIILSPFFSSVNAGTIEDTINIEEVVISGNRIEVARTRAPLTISVVGSEEIKSHEETNILPIVARITPGVFVSEIGVAGYALGNESSGQVTIRGVGGSPNSRVLMLVDGQPQYMGVFGHPLPNFHMSSNVDRVEVIRGPASLLYGSNAMGGVINVISRNKKSDGFNVGGHVSYGSFNTLKTGLSAGYSNDKFFAGISLNNNSTDGHRDSSEFKITNLHAYAGYRFNQSWTVRGGFTRADYSFMDPGSEYLDAITFSGDITRNMLTLSLKNDYDRTRGGLYAFYNSGNHNFSDGWVSQDVNMGVNLFQSVDIWNGASVTTGMDIKNYGGEGSFGFYADTFITVNETAGYVMAEQHFGDIINLSAGARYEYHTNFGAEIVPQFGISAQPLKGTTVKGIVSKGFRSPTIMEMYLFAPNAQLGPERLWNYELSVGQRVGLWGIVNTSVFLIDGSNLIVMQPNPEGPPPMIRTNGGEFTNWGIELEGNFQPFDNFRLNMSYSYLNADTKLYFAPEHQLYTGATYLLGDFRFSASIKSVAGLYTVIDMTDAVNDIRESYLIADSRISYRFMDNLEIFIAGKNLLNQDYQTVYGYTMPGIHMIGGFAVDFGR
ncbi:MAG: TonB-dependent receptor [Bacteroidales bacterium]|nr:TonB-dependent receptor [Bacteroidales bacterium]